MICSGKSTPPPLTIRSKSNKKECKFRTRSSSIRHCILSYHLDLMASNIIKTGGYNYRFVDGDPPTKYICHICTFVACKPQQVSCCGNVFCKSCLEELKSKGQQFICPICRHDLTNNYFNDRRADLEINSLQIYCTNKKESNDNNTCQWTGNLKDIEDHLKVCPYQLIDCTNKCGEILQRQNLQHHLNNECLKRQVSCQYCQTVATYEEIHGDHIKECPDYPIICDNKGCNKVTKRHLMEDHYNICPKQVISCQYKNIGCNVKMKREDQEKHEEYNMKKHLEMSVQIVKDLQEESDANKSLILQLQARLSYIIKSVKAPQTPLAKEICRVVKFVDFEKSKHKNVDWHSPGFYTSPGGYKMSLWIYPNGNDDGKGTHVSCFVCLMSGKYDDTLEWPFQEVVTMELLNQLEDKNHENSVITVNGSVPLKCRQRVVGKQYGNGLGYSQFIPHSELSLNSSLNRQYLKDDTLYFRVSVAVTSKTKPWLTNTT